MLVNTDSSHSEKSMHLSQFQHHKMHQSYPWSQGHQDIYFWMSKIGFTYCAEGKQSRGFKATCSFLKQEVLQYQKKKKWKQTIFQPISRWPILPCGPYSPSLPYSIDSFLSSDLGLNLELSSLQFGTFNPRRIGKTC